MYHILMTYIIYYVQSRLYLLYSIHQSHPSFLLPTVLHTENNQLNPDSRVCIRKYQTKNRKMEGQASWIYFTTMARCISPNLQVAQSLLEQENIFIYLVSFHSFSNDFSHRSIQIACAHQNYCIYLLNSSQILNVYLEQIVCGECQNVKSNSCYVTKPNAI